MVGLQQVAREKGLLDNEVIMRKPDRMEVGRKGYPLITSGKCFDINPEPPPASSL